MKDSASAHAVLGSVTACLEDFRGDLAMISVPVLIIHGDQDQALLDFIGNLGRADRRHSGPEDGPRSGRCR